MSQLVESLASKEGLERTETLKNYLRQKAFEKGIPLMGCFELTPRCTLDCKMCYVHLTENQMSRKELTTEEWIYLIDQACDAGMLYATLTGGECLLYPGFREIYEHLQERGVLITVLTNGTLLNEEMVRWLAARSPKRIQISVYGSSPIGYKNVTGNGEAFYLVDRAITLVKNSEIPFSLAITLSKPMVPDFEAIINYCKSKEPMAYDVTMYPFEARKETGRNYSDYFPSLDEQAEVYRIRAKLEGKSYLPFSCEEEVIEKSHLSIKEKETNHTGIQCTAGRMKFNICWDGRMTVCNSFNYGQTFPLRDGFFTAWNDLNKSACIYKNPKECDNCLYQTICLPCPALHWLSAGEGKVNPQVCDEAKKMALMGIRQID